MCICISIRKRQTWKPVYRLAQNCMPSPPLHKPTLSTANKANTQSMCPVQGHPRYQGDLDLLIQRAEAERLQTLSELQPVFRHWQGIKARPAYLAYLFRACAPGALKGAEHDPALAEPVCLMALKRQRLSLPLSMAASTSVMMHTGWR